MQKEIYKLQDINLPINELELNDDELIVLKGGTRPPDVASGNNCNCGCGDGGAGDGDHCNCGCGSAS